MPEWTYNDRMVVQTEQTLWNVVDMLQKEAQNDNGFRLQVEELYKAAQKLAAELRDYNDQWEVGE